MALHGSATIELTNADGSKQVVKHDNIVTNAANEMLRSYKGEQPVITRLSSVGTSYVTQLFGGIMLFNKPLNNNPEDYAINTTKITGYASQDAYNGVDVARGSANLSESGLQEDGSYKLVFDFDTSKANGQIQSIGLCPNIMGQIGASDEIDTSSTYLKGFDLSKSGGATVDTLGRMLDTSGYTDGIENSAMRLVAVIGDIAYAVNYYNVWCSNSSSIKAQNVAQNGGILKLYKFRLGAFSVGLGNTAGRAHFLECIDVQLPSDFISTLYNGTSAYTISYYFDVDNKKLIVFPCVIKTDVPVNGTVIYCEIDLMNNMAVTKRTFTNTTAGVLYYYSSTAGFREQQVSSHLLYILKNHIVLVTYIASAGKCRMYVIDKTDNSKVVEAKMGGVPFEEFGYKSGTGFGFAPIFVSDNILVFARIYVASSSADNAYYYMLDLTTGEIKRTNAKGLYVYSMVSFGNIATVFACDPYLACKTTLNPFILTTKNNLDTPVVKTASQTMKITYTLTESEGA